LLVNPPAEVRRQAKEKIAAIEYAAQQLQAEQNSLAHYETKRRRELGDDIRTLEDVARELRSVIFSEAD